MQVGPQSVCPRRRLGGLGGDMAERESAPSRAGDEDELFRAFNRQLIKAVASRVAHSSEQTIEDACAFAWTQLVAKPPESDVNLRGWLFRTAQREAWKRERHARREPPLGDGRALTGL